MGCSPVAGWLLVALVELVQDDRGDAESDAGAGVAGTDADLDGVHGRDALGPDQRDIK